MVKAGTIEEVKPVDTEPMSEQDTVTEPDVKSPDAPVWPGGPSQGQVDGWKAEYGDVYVTSVTPDKHIVWRTISRTEYRFLVTRLEEKVASGQLTQAEANLDNEEAIAEITILWPKVTKESMAKDLGGVASIIAQEVMEASGFVALEVRQL